MNKIIIILGIIISLQSCQSDTKESYYPNGMVAYKVPQKNGKNHGEMISYYANGDLKGKASFEDGNLSGEAIVYDSLGNIYSTFHYRKNKKNGKFKIYYKDGTVQVEGEYRNNEPHGRGFEYYPNGELMRKYVYYRGELVYMKAYDENGVQYDSKLDINITEINGQDSAFIELSYSEYDSAGIIVVFGKLNPQKRLMDTLAIYGSKDMELKFKYPNNKKLISGILYEMKLPEETLEAAFYFEHKLQF